MASVSSAPTKVYPDAGLSTLSIRGRHDVIVVRHSPHMGSMKERTYERRLSPNIEYRFLALYSQDMAIALSTLSKLRQRQTDDFCEMMLRDIIIAYSRPFSSNRGPDSTRHRLSLEFVPQECRALHVELMDLRNRLFAHTDMSARKPVVKSYPGNANFIAIRDADYATLLSRIDDIEALIGKTWQALGAALRRVREDVTDG